MLVNTMLVIVAVLTRKSISIGILAIALNEATNMSLMLSELIIQWTRES